MATKLRYHAVQAYGSVGLVESVTYAGFEQEINSPREWGQGATGYGKRLGSSLAYSGVRNALAFDLDTTLRQNPRYYRASEGGFWLRTKHAVRGTIITHTDSGKETLSTWRLGSAYGAAFLSMNGTRIALTR
jgi:hypothetical protein